MGGWLVRLVVGSGKSVFVFKAKSDGPSLVVCVCVEMCGVGMCWDRMCNPSLARSDSWRFVYV
jgi:hypothetical protein